MKRTGVFVAVGGVGLTIAMAATSGMAAVAAAELAAWACAAAVIAGAAGAMALVAGRSWSVATQITVAALTAIAGVGAGAAAAAQEMFISRHDLDALLVVMAAAGTVSVLVAVALGHRVAAASRSLGVAASQIGQAQIDKGQEAAAIGDPATGELAALGRQLEEMVRRVDEARRAERAIESSRREVVAWISHDLCTPLAGIRAIVEALEDNVDDDPTTVARYHRTLRQEADRLALLVDDLHELSGLQPGDPDLVAPDPTPPDAIAADLPSDLVADTGTG